MPKISIYSDDYKNGQYLKSLVYQVDTAVDINIYGTHQLRLDTGAFQEGLLVVDWDLENDLAEIIGQANNPHVFIFWITNNSLSDMARSDLKVFSRPLDVSVFINSIYQWYIKQTPNSQCLPPAEPYLIGNNSHIRNLRQKIIKVADSRINVLICGPTGTGKGVVAQAIHNKSSHRDRNFLVLNCAAVPSNLLESELFGYKKGAFTGACRDKSGLFDLVRQGTMFLDEISEMSPYMQAKLLQVLQEKEFCPVGGEQNKQLKARTIAATNADLKKAVDTGRFRNDLYYRLAVVRLDIPLLRDRKEDIPVLARYFLDKFRILYNKKDFSSPSQEFWELIEAYDWPGNVRELESSIKTMVASENEDAVKEVLREKMPEASKSNGNGLGLKRPDLDLALKQKMSLKEISGIAARQVESALIRQVMRKTGGKKKIAADALGVSYKCLLKKIQNYGL
jgi:transcriptional regulator with PAS, ATPase and Fis domain